MPSKFGNSKDYEGPRWKTTVRMAENQQKLVEDNLLKYLDSARNRLAKCITRCTQPPPLTDYVVAQACKYFQCSEASQIGTLLATQVVPTLELVINGLNCNQTIKVGEVVGDDKKALGHTRFDFDPNSFNSGKAHQNLINVKAVSGTAKAGAIHVRQDLLVGYGNMKLGTVTLIHEATHKYAGTVDFFSWGEEGEDVDLIMSEDLAKRCLANNPTFEKDFEEPTKMALCDADSLAWFVMNVGKN